MFINPKIAIEKGWVKFPEWMSEEQQHKCIQPNALDLTVDHIFHIAHSNVFFISEDTKQMRGGSEIIPVDGRHPVKQTDLCWNLTEGVYDILSDFYVEIPENVAAMLIVRSTFNRNGLYITSGLYDQGFKNNVGMTLHNRSGNATIVKGTRIAQIIFIESQSSGHLYSGGYNKTGSGGPR